MRDVQGGKQSKLSMTEKMRTPGAGTFNSTFLIESSGSSLPSNGVTIA